MIKKMLTSLCFSTLCIVAIPGQAGDPDPQQCMECHEPAEDWAGMSVEEIMADARAPDNKRHEDNQSLSDEQLRLIIGALLPIE
jgi:hypothetical protein